MICTDYCPAVQNRVLEGMCRVLADVVEQAWTRITKITPVVTGVNTPVNILGNFTRVITGVFTEII